MNLPNQITLVRVLLVPVFVVVMLIEDIPYNNIIACVIFSVACISDFLDGYLARKNNLVTNFGKFADPLADKMLVSSALICLIGESRLLTCAVIIIICREFIISGLRLIAADSGVVIAASYWGKVKTVTQMFMCIFLIADINNPVIDILEQVLIWASLILTVISLVDYVFKNRKIITEGGM